MSRKRKSLGGTRHKLKGDFEIPAWVLEASPCLSSVAEDVYIAKSLAKAHGANREKNCQGLLRAAEKSLRQMENPKVEEKKRCAEGDRAARKYWEAKVCARQR